MRSAEGSPESPLRLMAISDRRSLPGGDLEEWASRLQSAGVECLQLREKDLDDRQLYELAGRIRPLFPPPGRLLVNGRVDIALAVGADGVHLPANGLPLAPLRQRFGDRLLLGRSTHAPQEVTAAMQSGADYVTFGPVYATPSKARYGEPVGLEALAEAASHGLPVLALGGLDADRLETVAEHGASGAAGIGMFLDPQRAAEVVVRCRQIWPRERV